MKRKVKKKASAPESGLSEIEACVLGLIAVDGPATPYAIRKVFLKSPTPQWSGSAGTIYPLMERLLRRKMIRSEIFITGKRRGSRFSLTTAGSKAFQRWLQVPIPDWVAGVPPDPLRTRVRFLGIIGRDQQVKFLQDAHRRVQTHLAILKADRERWRAIGGYGYLMARGAYLSMQAKSAFLKEVADAADISFRAGS